MKLLVKSSKNDIPEETSPDNFPQRSKGETWCNIDRVFWAYPLIVIIIVLFVERCDEYCVHKVENCKS